MKFSAVIFSILIAAIVASGFVFIGTALTALLLLLWFSLVLRRAFANGYAVLLPLGGWMLAWLAWLSVGVWASTAHNVSWQTAWMLACLPISYLAWGMTPSPEKVWGILRAMMLLAGPVFALWGLGQVVTGYGNGQPVGPLVDRNAFAALMNLFWFSASAYFVNMVQAGGKRRSVVIQALGLLLIAMTLFASESRGAMLTWLILMPILLWSAYKHTRNRFAIMLVLAVALAGYMGTTGILGLSVTHRTMNIEEDTSSNARLQLWESAARITLDHPVFGTGWGTFAASYPAYRDPKENTTAGLYAHNDYIQLASEGGIPALILLLGMVMGLFWQLKRSMNQKHGVLEATGLLLGVLALFIHAAVNFIFYFAFMNILAGLLAARAVQLINSERHVAMGGWSQIGRATKALMAGFVALLLAGPLMLQLFAQLTLSGSQPGLALMQAVWPQASAYRIAKFVSAARPSLGIAQELMLQSGEAALESSEGISMEGGNFQRELLNETLGRYELVRAQTADSPAYGVREANLLMRYQNLLDPGIAYKRARDILTLNLRRDPFHVDSMIALSRLDVAEGRAREARQLLEASMQRVLSRRDQQLLVVELLRQRAAPRKIVELDLIEKQLRNIKSSSETGKLVVLKDDFGADIDKRLKRISESLVNY